MSPQVLRPGQDLTVTVHVRNTGAAAVARPRVVVSISTSSFISRSSLDTWRTADPEGRVGWLVAQLELPAPLEPGQSATAEVVVPAAQVPLPHRLTAWGARGMAVTVVDRADDARPRLGIARTFLVWFPEQEVNPTHLSILAPVVGPAVDPRGGTWTDRLDEATADGGRLAELVAATGAYPAVTWVLDPWLLDGTADAGPATQAWADDLRDGLTDREVQLLPYLDPDLAALAHTEHDDLLAAATARAESAARTAGLPDAARVRLAWPPDAQPDLATAALAGRSTDLVLVVGPGVLTPPAVLTYTPSGRASLTAGGRDVTVLVPDERLSGALLTGRVGPMLGDGTAPAGAGAVTGATAAQDLLAELAVITRERPNDSRHVLLTAPRDWAPDAEVVAAQLEALAVAPWVRLEPVSALIGLANPEIDRGTLPDRQVSEAEVGGPEIGALGRAGERRAALAEILPDPAAVIGDPELETLALVGTAWRERPAGRARMIDAAQAAADAIADGVRAEPPTEVVNLISRSGDLPLHVRNDLTEPVDVVVGLRPSDQRLRADETVPVTIPAESTALVQIPVHAVQSADVSVTVEVRTPSGALIDNAASFPVRVRADWEGIGAAIIGGLLGIGLIVGLVRTVRRGRTARRAAPEPAAGPDTLSPEVDEPADDDADDAADPAADPADADPADADPAAAEEVRP